MGKELFKFQREVNQELFFQALKDTYEYVEKNFCYENDTFYMQTYNWNNEEDERPNFYHKPSGFKLWWYKYPMRATECNMQITHEQFLAILYDCRNSLKNSETHLIDKWWDNPELLEKGKE